MRFKVWFAAGLLLACTSLALAQEKKPKQEMTPEMMKMMEAYAKAATPGDAHKMLEPMVGMWDAKVSWFNPNTNEPAVKTGSAESKWVLGGRFVEQRYSGSMMGQPFTGVGYTGYDNVKKQYVGTWIDSMGTGMMMSTGSTSDGGKTWKFVSTYPDPMTGKDMTMEEKVTVVDKDKHVFEMWSPGPDGKMYKSMEIVYTRKKS